MGRHSKQDCWDKKLRSETQESSCQDHETLALVIISHCFSDQVFPSVRYQESKRIHSYGAACGKFMKWCSGVPGLPTTRPTFMPKGCGPVLVRNL